MKNIQDLINNIFAKARSSFIVLWPDQLNEMTITFDKDNLTTFSINDLQLKAQRFWFDESRSVPHGNYCVISMADASPDAFFSIAGFYPDESLIVFEYPDHHSQAQITFVRVEG